MKALGLRKMNQSVEVEATPQILGMVKTKKKRFSKSRKYLKWFIKFKTGRGSIKNATALVVVRVPAGVKLRKEDLKVPVHVRVTRASAVTKVVRCLYSVVCLNAVSTIRILRWNMCHQSRSVTKHGREIWDHQIRPRYVESQPHY